MTTPDEQEQRTGTTGDLAPGAVPELPLEVPEADAVEQAQVVPLDDDDRRD